MGMDFNDKINLYISPALNSVLEQDMRTFEFFDAEKSGYNRSGFLNDLIRGYYQKYLEENEHTRNEILKALQGVSLDEAGKEKIALDIMRNLQISGNQKKQRGQSITFPFKPRNALSGILQQFEELSRVYEESLPTSIIRMLIAYSRKPLIEREQIVFHDNYEKLRQYCETRQPIVLTTKWDRDLKTRQDKAFPVVPWAIASGPDEIHNYLLCQREDPHTRLLEACPFALHRIRSVTVRTGKGRIDPEVERHLEMMREQGPAYAVNTDEVIRVKLSREGVRLYHRIYFGRPKVNKKDIISCGDGKIYHFKCSENQAFFYFRRLDPREVEILSPASLRDRIMTFFQSGLDVYDPSFHKDTQ